jgi:hypothetical protein
LKFATPSPISTYEIINNVEHITPTERGLFCKDLAESIDDNMPVRTSLRRVSGCMNLKHKPTLDSSLASVCDVFDKKGNKHKWDTYLIGDAEYKADDFANAITNGKPITGNISDMKCSTCGRKRSDKGSNDGSGNDGSEKEVMNSLFKKKQVDIKYITPKPTLQPTTDYPEYKTWKFDITAVTTFASSIGCNYKYLVSLGSLEKQKYSDIVGEYIATPISTKYHTRIARVSSYLRDIFVTYNQLRTRYEDKKIWWLKRLLETSNIHRSELQILAPKLEKLPTDIFDKIDWFANNKKPYECVDFIIENIVKVLTMIQDSSKHPIIKAYISTITKKILDSDSLTSIPGYFSWSSYYGYRDNITDDSAAVVIHDDDGGEGAQLNIPPLPEGKEDKSVFSMDAYDIDDMDEDTTLIHFD